MHGDLKSANVLLAPAVAGEPCRYVPKIADFGMSRMLGGLSASTISTARTGGAAASGTAAGTLAWMAPEMLTGSRATEGSDVYAFGMTVYEIVTQQRPFAGVDAAVLPSIVMNGKRPALPVLQEEHVSATPAGAALLALMTQCWAPRPAARPRFRFLEHQLLALCDGLQREQQQAKQQMSAPAAAAVPK